MGDLKRCKVQLAQRSGELATLQQRYLLTEATLRAHLYRVCQWGSVSADAYELRMLELTVRICWVTWRSCIIHSSRSAKGTSQCKEHSLEPGESSALQVRELLRRGPAPVVLHVSEDAPTPSLIWDDGSVTASSDMTWDTAFLTECRS